MPAFDELRAVVAGGDGGGVVVRLPGLLAVAQGSDDAVLRLVEMCRECAGPAPGRALARRLAAWLGSDDDLADELRFGTVAATDRGLAVFLSGTVDLLVPDRGTAIVGADAATWTDRLIEAPDAPVALTLQGATAPADLLESVYDLWEGVVPGVAVVAVAAGVATPGPVLPVETSGAETPRAAEGGDPGDGRDTGEHRALDVPPPADAGPPAPTPSDPAPPDPAPPGSAPSDPGPGPSGFPPDAGDDATAVMSRRPEDGRPRHRLPTDPGNGSFEPRAPRPGPSSPGGGPSPGHPPAPVQAATPEQPDVPERPRIPPGARAGAAQRGDGPPMAEGYLCARGHLNDPSSHFCVLCGIRMNERTGVLVVAERPPLGLLVFDDGVTHTVDSGFLLGREPDGDARVRAGVLRPIVLEDRSGAMSRVHAEIRLENWDVLLTDSGSSNGTLVAEPGATVWTRLPSGRPFRLVPGARVRLGQRTFTFETPSGVR